MPQDNLGNNYEVTHRGVNEAGNSYTETDFGPGHANDNTYRYDNKDGDYYYSNPDGSNYYSGKNGGPEVYQPAGDGGPRFTREDGKDGNWEYENPNAGFSGTNVDDDEEDGVGQQVDGSEEYEEDAVGPYDEVDDVGEDDVGYEDQDDGYEDADGGDYYEDDYSGDYENGDDDDY